MVEKKNINEMIKTASKPLKTFEEADRRKGGRPKKEDGHTKKNKVTVYLDDEELEIVTNAGKEIGLSVGLYIKASALKAAKS
ncbi:MAG: ribbon-helix-helix domain-containing protein [Sulfuricurvum sp.]|jgi:hypothetical protein|uniref:hypothetical protein n=1 Tax=Sulfuricurvum sp. TaxID=2025608 RepID=UPI0025F3AEB0|nr:hypothetical protein [Sulfuricurvum sp.]MCK9373620.1 ribbon-helix-helix domain-containing protein [Sulfuricurvum sp.]